MVAPKIFLNKKLPFIGITLMYGWSAVLFVLSQFSKLQFGFYVDTSVILTAIVSVVFLGSLFLAVFQLPDKKRWVGLTALLLLLSIYTFFWLRTPSTLHVERHTYSNPGEGNFRAINPVTEDYFSTPKWIQIQDQRTPLWLFSIEWLTELYMIPLVFIFIYPIDTLVTASYFHPQFASLYLFTALASYFVFTGLIFTRTRWGKILFGLFIAAHLCFWTFCAGYLLMSRGYIYNFPEELSPQLKLLK